MSMSIVRSCCFISYYSSLCLDILTYSCRSFFSVQVPDLYCLRYIFIQFSNIVTVTFENVCWLACETSSYIKNALECNVYHRRLCYFLNQATMAYKICVIKQMGKPKCDKTLRTFENIRKISWKHSPAAGDFQLQKC